MLRSPKTRHVQRCDVLQVANDAYEAAAVLCDGEYFDHPNIAITAMDVTDDDLDTQVAHEQLTMLKFSF